MIPWWIGFPPGCARCGSRNPAPSQHINGWPWLRICELCILAMIASAFHSLCRESGIEVEYTITRRYK